MLFQETTMCILKNNSTFSMLLYNPSDCTTVFCGFSSCGHLLTLCCTLLHKPNTIIFSYYVFVLLLKNDIFAFVSVVKCHNTGYIIPITRYYVSPSFCNSVFIKLSFVLQSSVNQSTVVRYLV